VKIHYKNKKDKAILTDQRKIVRYYNKSAQSIMNRLTELLAADSLDDIPISPPPVRHKLVGTNQWAVKYSKNYRIIFEPWGEYNINDLKSIKEIRILKLDDYH